MRDLLDFVALSLLPPWGRLSVAERLRAGDAPAVALARLLWRDWHDRPEERATLHERARAAIDRAHAHEIRPLVWTDANYPAALTTIADPPAMLWVRGSVPALSAASVAIVGARAASPYGLSVAERLAADLTTQGLAIVSGLARGVDSAAHRGALSAGGVTIGVLGSGVDVMYPAEHASLARNMELAGAVISEYAPGTPPL